MITFILIICIFIILLYVNHIQSNMYYDYDYELFSELFSSNSDNDNYKPYLFSYWELKKGVTKRPGYIDLCFSTMKKNGKLFNVQILDNISVLKFLPNLRKDINELPLALKADYIRICLLYKYGGLWLDADVIMMSDMNEVVELLKKGEDFIGFGCTGHECYYGYGKPSNWAMGATKGSIMMKNCMNELDNKLNEYFSISPSERKKINYYDLGKLIIWNNFKKLNSSGYKYYHFPSYVDGTRDKYGNWIAPNVIFDKEFDVDLNKLMIMVLANSYYCNKSYEYHKYNWFCDLSEDQVLNGNYFISKVFRKALDK